MKTFYAYQIFYLKTVNKLNPSNQHHIKHLVFLCFLVLSSIFAINLPAQVHSRPDIYSFSPAERCELRNLMVTYLNIGGGTVAFDHQNPPGPTTFVDIHCYNEFFLSWHRTYIRALEEWLLTQNGGAKYVPLPEWDPTTSIPCEFFNNTCTTCPGSAIASGFNNLVNQNPSGYNFNRFLNTVSLCSYTSGMRTPPQFGKSARLGSAIDNFAWDLQREHNNPHVSIGGIMATATSPASAIFWLWHGYIDDIYRLYQCSCEGDTPKDLYIADTNMDIGNEPNVTSTTDIYLSPEIWVRNTQDVIGADGRYAQEDDPQRHQNPEAGQNNYIYVRIRNIGCEPTQAGDTNLRVYYSKASTGLHWPTHWVNYQQLAITYGDEVPTSPIAIPAINPGEQFVAELEWFPPAPSSFGETESHICLLGRLESTVDPMAFVETTSVGANTVNNNNIAWKNLKIVDLNPFMFGNSTPQEIVFEVIQPANSLDPIKLEFTKLGNFDLDRVIIKASPEVMDTLLAQGQIMGMERIDDPFNGEPAFSIEGDSASFENLVLSPGQSVPIRLRFDFKCPEQGGLPCANFGDIYRYNVKQFSQGIFGDGFIGGVGYELRIKQSPETNCDPIIVNTNIENPSCENNATGFIGLELDGQGPYKIYWNNGASTPEIGELFPGNYRVTVVDQNNCIDTMSFELFDLSNLNVEFESIAPSCATPNGAINAIVSGGMMPYSFEWSNGSQASSIEELGYGTYLLTITDAAGCQRTGEASIGTTMLLGGVSIGTDASSSASNDGSAYIIPTGGTPPYSFNWSNGASSDSIANLIPGAYIINLSDNLGCTFIDTIIVDFVNSIEHLPSKIKQIELSPNPTSDDLQIQLKHWDINSVDITISDISGKVHRNFNQLVTNNSLLINLNELPTGVYFITLKNNSTSISDKFIKIK